MFLRKNIVLQLISAIPFIVLSYLGSFISGSLIIGSPLGSSFSLRSCFFPLTGKYSGIIGSLYGVICSGILNNGSTYHSVSYLSLAYYIPGLFASWYFAITAQWFRVGIPVLCMIIFCLHPIGMYAAPYTLLWIIPIIVGLSERSSMIADAFGATFTAHAVGTVIWIYATPMTLGQWYGLIPLVIFERTIFALSMVIINYGITQSISYIRHRTVGLYYALSVRSI